MPTGTKAGDIGGLKRALRDKIGLLKKQATQEEIEEKSLRILDLLFNTAEFKGAGTILFYASIGREVQTGRMIAEALKLGKRIALPKIAGEKLELCPVSGLEELETNSMGIPEPKGGQNVPLDGTDLIILPGIAFDISGNRLGRGKGYYDRLLSEAGRIPSIALAFEFQVLDRIPSGPTDRKVDKIITETRVIECRK